MMERHDPGPRDRTGILPFQNPQLVWRCLECGNVGVLDTGSLPASCPDCSAGPSDMTIVNED